ncbi:MAG TPA: histidine kinase [Cytophagales bacterium]
MLFPYLFFNTRSDSPYPYYRLLFTAALLMGVFYLNLLVLVPRLLRTKRVDYYVLQLLAILVGNVLLEIRFESFFAAENVMISSPSPAVVPLLAPPGGNEGDLAGFLLPMKAVVSRSVLITLLVIASSTSIRLAGEWFRNDRLKQEIENEKLTSELNFLKSQVNPHFFFNTLNNIYSLAYRKSDKAPLAIARLSQLMRYLLSSSGKAKVRLQEEIEYIDSYIDLMRLRFTDGFRVRFGKEGKIEDHLIEPMLLIPFVENAFKYSPAGLTQAGIDIRLSVHGYTLTFTVENPYQPDQPVEPSTSTGIGQVNVEKRLALLYPGQHELNITKAFDTYRVALKIQLHP